MNIRWEVNLSGLVAELEMRAFNEVSVVNSKESSLAALDTGKLYFCSCDTTRLLQGICHGSVFPCLVEYHYNTRFLLIVFVSPNRQVLLLSVDGIEGAVTSYLVTFLYYLLLLMGCLSGELTFLLSQGKCWVHRQLLQEGAILDDFCLQVKYSH